MASLIDELREKREVRLTKIAALKKEADGLLVTIEILEEEAKLTTQSSLTLSSGPGRPPGRSRETTPIVQKIEAILRSHGGMMHRRDILRELEADGIRFTGETEGVRLGKLGAHLSNYKRRFEPVTRPGDGRWRLKEHKQK